MTDQNATELRPLPSPSGAGDAATSRAAVPAPDSERMRLGLCPDEDCGGILTATLPLAAVFLNGMAIVDEVEPGSFAMTVQCDQCCEEVDVDGDWDLRFASDGVA